MHLRDGLRTRSSRNSRRRPRASGHPRRRVPIARRTLLEGNRRRHNGREGKSSGHARAAPRTRPGRQSTGTTCTATRSKKAAPAAACLDGAASRGQRARTGAARAIPCKAAMTPSGVVAVSWPSVREDTPSVTSEEWRSGGGCRPGPRHRTHGQRARPRQPGPRARPQSSRCPAHSGE